MPAKRLFAAVLLAFCLSAELLIAQASNQSDPKPAPQSETSPDRQEPAPPPKAEKAAPERKITPEEAEDLFKSVDEILRFASQQTGLAIKHPVKHKLTSRDEVQKFIEKRMKEDPDAKRMEDSEFVMKKFGLLPNDFNLRTFMVAMLREQLAGYYDTKTKTMNLLDWLPPEVQKPVMAHELTHALQDQFVDLEKWEEGGKPEGKKLPLQEQLAMDELRVARQSVTEGQAMLVLIDYSLQPIGRTSADSPDAVKMMEDQMMDGTGSPVFASAPLYIKRALMFAYREGSEFEEQVLVNEGKDAAFQGTLKNPPNDTREVMQPGEYLAGRRVPLLSVPDYDKVLGHDWQQIDFGSIGEFDVNVITELYDSAESSARLTPGWRGGYYYAAHRKGAPPQDIAFVYVSKWSDDKTASDFARIFAGSWKQRYQSLRTEPGNKESDIVRKQTEAGQVSVEHNGNLVIAIESFPAEESARLRKAALEADSGDSKANTFLLPRPGPAFDLRGYLPISATWISAIDRIQRQNHN